MAEQQIQTPRRQRLPGLALLLALVAAAPLVLALWPAAAPAATIRVDSKADALAGDSACTLREAVIAANSDAAVLGCAAGSGDDVILLGTGTYNLTIPPSGTPFDPTTGSLDVFDPQGQDLAIGSFVGEVAINASAIGDRVLTTRSPLVFNYLTIGGGDSSGSAEATGSGGAVAALAGTSLALRHSLLVGNHAAFAGGAIHSTGPLEISNSTLSGNTIDSPTGGGGGAIDATGTTLIARSTLADNSVQSDDDTASGGAVRFAGGLVLVGSILADNSADGGDPECHSTGPAATSGGYNVLETNDAGCNLTPVGSDAIADPGLTGLADNGGTERTYALAAGSPAVDIGPVAGAASCSGELDQRRVPRGTPEAGPCDAGAYELSYCSYAPANLVGSPGGDVLRSAKPQISALGLDGQDAIYGGNGNDAICGGAGTDTMTGGGGADVLVGGAGVDIASYEGVGQPVAVRLDNLANDGRAGEGDLVLAESVVGGAAADLIVGSAVPNGVQGGPGDDRINGAGGSDSLLGQAGNDAIDGAAGNDQLRGGDGDDTVLGSDGDDRLEGDDGNDRLDGGPGADRIYGEAGRNVLIGGDGNDRIYAGPGRDQVDCGAGRDRVEAAKKTKVKRNCEKVKRPGKKKGKKGKKKGKGKKKR